MGKRASDARAEREPGEKVLTSTRPAPHISAKCEKARWEVSQYETEEMIQGRAQVVYSLARRAEAILRSIYTRIYSMCALCAVHI